MFNEENYHLVSKMEKIQQLGLEIVNIGDELVFEFINNDDPEIKNELLNIARKLDKIAFAISYGEY